MTFLSPSRMTLLWSGIVIVALCMGFGGIWMHDRYYEDAFAKATQDAQRANDAAVEHSQQVIGQADTLLRAVREFYLRTGSVEETERFIEPAAAKRPARRSSASRAASPRPTAGSLEKC